MRLVKFFTRGIMAKDPDERAVPQGMYRHAENIRVTNSDGSNAGLLEDLKGMIKRSEVAEIRTDTPITTVDTIGVGKDDYAECIYWLIATNGDDYLLEYNKRTKSVLRVLQGDLNLNKGFPVSEIHVIRDSYSGNTYLTWTDDRNPPRFINLKRAKGYAINGFTEDDISLIKKPPRKEPKIEMYGSTEYRENYMEEKFLCFAYRYKYLDGEYSALSSFTEYAFNPKPFNLDFATKENSGMLNQFNTVRLLFNTGSKRVVGIDLVYKEAGSNTIYKIQTFNKADEGWADDVEQEYIFKNDKVYSVLPEKELYRLFDSVPLKAKDVALIDNRLLFTNITEGRNMIGNNGHRVSPDYSLSLVGDKVLNEVIPSENNTFLIINLDGVTLTAGQRLIFRVTVRNTDYGGYYNGVFDFVLTQDFANAYALFNDPGFQEFVETVWTNDFLQGYNIVLPEHSQTQNTFGFQIMPHGIHVNKLYIRGPVIEFITDLTPNNPSDNNFSSGTALFSFVNPSKVELSNYSSTSSLKSNRSYEIGMVYLDEQNRQSPTLVDGDNTIFVPIERSTYKNQIQVELKNRPPAWADRYKFVLKQNKWGHETIYCSIYYVDGVYRWVLLDGENKHKVKEGDTLVVKGDIDGPAQNLVKVKVIEVKEQPINFLKTIESEEEDDGVGRQLAGTYMKIRPNGFNMGLTDSDLKMFGGFNETSPQFGEEVEESFVPYELKQGSLVSISLVVRPLLSDNVYFQKDYVVQNDYPTYKDWFDTEVITLGDIENYLTDFGVNNEHRFFAEANTPNTSVMIMWNVLTSSGLVILETEPKELDIDVYYETGETFEIENGFHKGNIQDQTNSENAIVLLNSHNCFVQGNGAESYKIKDGLNGNSLNIDTRPTTTIDDEYKERKLFSTYTWGGNYEEFTQYNSLNEFNRATMNIKQLDDKYGSIQRVLSREGNALFFQENKISQAPYRKRALYNQDGSMNIAATDVDFDNAIPYLGEYGVSMNPESVATFKNRVYFTDRKRGVVCRLSTDGIEEIPGYYYDTGNVRRETMGDWFKKALWRTHLMKIVGCYDPEYGEYTLHLSSSGSLITKDQGENPEDVVFSETLSFSESAGGWTSFYTYAPERMISMNGKMYAFKKGDLYECNADANSRNNFFGVQYLSKIKALFNEHPGEVKVFHALNIEGNKAWDVDFKTNLTTGKILKSEFKEVEAEWYAHFRKNEVRETHSQATQGIGQVVAVGPGFIEVDTPSINPAVSIGDGLFLGDFTMQMGFITSIVGNRINYASFSSEMPPTADIEYGGMFAFAQKNMRVEGSEIRGYYLEFEMTSQPESRVELYSVNAEISKSYP